MSEAERGVRGNVHCLETIIGHVLVRGFLSDKAVKELEALARDDALWLRFWNVGVQEVQLVVSVPNAAP